jgi:hypothetical protein
MAKKTIAKSKRPAAVRAAANPIPALRKFQAMLAEDLAFDFLSARSAVMTAILALEGKGGRDLHCDQPQGACAAFARSD